MSMLAMLSTIAAVLMQVHSNARTDLNYTAIGNGQAQQQGILGHAFNLGYHIQGLLEVMHRFFWDKGDSGVP